MGLGTEGRQPSCNRMRLPEWGRRKTCNLQELLQVRLMEDRGFCLGNLDATIILQRPKLSPHKPAINANLCRLLKAHPSTVNIKVHSYSRPRMHACTRPATIADCAHGTMTGILLACQVC